MGSIHTQSKHTPGYSSNVMTHNHSFFWPPLCFLYLQERDRAATRLMIIYISANTPLYNYIYFYNHNTGMI